MIRTDDSDFLTPEQEQYLAKYDTEFDELTGKLVRSAIDAFMRSEGFALDRTANQYYKDGFWIERGKIHDRCEAPGPDGTGGGHHWLDYGVDADHQYYSAFNYIQDMFKKWFDKFRDLPDPKNFVSVIDAVVNVGDTLAVGANGEGPMEDSLNEIEARAAQLKGDTADTYRANFINQFDAVLDGHYGIAAVITHYLVAQKGTWAAARADFIRVVVEATAAFDDAARELSNKTFGDLMLTVADVALSAAKLIATPTTTGIDWAMLAVGEMSKIGPGKEATKTEYSAIRDRTVALFDGIDQQIRAVENQIYDNAGLNMDRVSGATAIERPGQADPHANRNIVRANFKLVPAYLDPSRLSPAEISADQASVDYILKRMLGGADAYGTEVHGVVPTLTAALNLIPTADEFVAPAVRGHDVGRGHYGPMLALNEFRDMFADLVKTLRDDVRLSADNFEIAYGILLAEDGRAEVTVQSVLAQLNALENPSGYDDPWRYDKTPAPNESFHDQYRDKRA